MNPNFQKQQLTDEFIQAVRANPSQTAFKAYQKDLFEQVNTEAVKRWDAMLSMSQNYIYIREFIGLSAFLLMYSFGCFMTGEVMFFADGVSTFGILWSLFFGGVIWFHFAETYHHYRCSEQAIAIHRYKNQPHSLFVAMRISAWVGVVFCIVITIWVGPMAFVGAGASALMAFKMIDAKRVDLYWTIQYNSVLLIDTVRKDNYIAIWFKDVDFDLGTESPQISENVTIYGLSCKPEQFDDILTTLKSKLHPEVQIVESDSLDDSINFFEEAKKHDISLISVTLHEEEQQKTEFDSTEDSW